MIELGKKLNGRYHIIGNIGSGGMANVFLAHDLILDRDVAVKVLRFDFRNDQSAIRRFQREALAASELVHPNIVSVYDVGEEGGLQYIVMEYVRGMDLKRYIQTGYPVAYPTIVDIMEQILSAVSLAHEHRIIHRDLKPQNILIDENGVVKITDFGIAIALSETSITQTNTMLGSVHYLSPEQARGSMATNQSDIYAVGIILYEILTGNVPFDGESAVTIALKHFQEDIPSVKIADPNIPQSLENVVLHATTKDPANRYKTAEEMAQDLYTVLAANRLNEPVWQPTALLGETKILTPITDEMTMPSSFQKMEVPEEQVEPEKQAVVEKKKKKSKKPLMIILSILLVGLLILGSLYLLGSKGEVKVPDVAGKTEAEAIKILEEAKLKISSERKEVPDETIPAGNIVKTDPSVDSMVKEGKEVVLYISSGTNTIKIGNYTDWEQKKAVEDLKNRGFLESNIKLEKDTSLEIDENKVISQTPEEGTEVDPKADTITLVISTGPEKVTVGNYTGYSYENAVYALTMLGINEIQISKNEQASDEVGAGLVLSQDPAAGTGVNPKTGKITLTVSKGSDKVTIGNYSGYSYENAVNALKDLGIKESQISQVEEASDSVEKGLLIKQDPSAGSTFDTKNGKITLTISKGSDSVTLGDISGSSKNAAQSYLSNLGLKMDAKTEYSDTVPKDQVIRTSPANGSSVARGGTVTVYISLGTEKATDDSKTQ